MFVWQAHIPNLTQELSALFSAESLLICNDPNEAEMLELFYLACGEIYESAEKDIQDSVRAALSTGEEGAYLAIICQGLFRRRKIGRHNHFEEEQVLWKIEAAGGDVSYGRDVLKRNSQKYEQGSNLTELILYKDGRADGKYVYFLNSHKMGDTRTLCEKYALRFV